MDIESGRDCYEHPHWTSAYIV